MWYAKMYFSGEREFFENDAFGMQGLPSKQLELPFLESLLTFLEHEEKEITPMVERISVNWERFVESRAREAYTAAMVELGVLAEKHIYLRLLYTRSFGCFSVNGFDQAEIQAIALDLKEFAKQFSETRKQVEKFFECVLDVDSAGREPQKQAAKNYHHDQPRDPELFRFEPIPLSFEPVEPGRCAPVLYSSAVRDMIDYSLRSCVERGVTVRRCKNCGRWFPQTGRVSSAAARSARSGSGRKNRPTTLFSRHTARSTKSASRGSKPAASPTSSFMLGARKPEKKRKNATARSSRWRNSSSGSATPKYKTTLPASCRQRILCL